MPSFNKLSGMLGGPATNPVKDKKSGAPKLGAEPIPEPPKPAPGLWGGVAGAINRRKDAELPPKKQPSQDIRPGGGLVSPTPRPISPPMMGGGMRPEPIMSGPARPMPIPRPGLGRPGMWRPPMPRPMPGGGFMGGMPAPAPQPNPGQVSAQPVGPITPQPTKPPMATPEPPMPIPPTLGKPPISIPQPAPRPTPPVFGGGMIGAPAPAPAPALDAIIGGGLIGKQPVAPIAPVSRYDILRQILEDEERRKRLLGL